MRRVELLLIQAFYRFFNWLGKMYPAYQKRKDSNFAMIVMVLLAMLNFLFLKHIVIPYNDRIVMLGHFISISVITGIAVKMDLDNHPKNSSDNKKISLDLAIVFMAALIVPTIVINGFVVINEQVEIAKLLKLVGLTIIPKEVTK